MVHKSIFPSNVKTSAKLCQVMRQRFDSSTKREPIPKPYSDSVLTSLLKKPTDLKLRRSKTSTKLVLRIEKLASVATPEQEAYKAKITVLMNSIEMKSWFIAATAGTESIRHFTGVVEKVNHELAKQAVKKPNLNRMKTRQGSERARVIREILYALGEEDD